MLSDACRKTIEFASALAGQYQLPGWRQSECLKRQHRKRYNKARNLKHSSAACEMKQRLRQHDVEMAHLEYLKYSLSIIRKAELTLSLLAKQQPDEQGWKIFNITLFIARHQIDLIYRRVIEHEQIPHHEKVFSIFEPHTEWISKGKAGTPVELGLRVCVLQDQFGFTLHHQVMQKQTDDQVAVPMAEGAKKRFSALNQVSYDKGFWSPGNLEKLDVLLERAVLPKKGSCQAVIKSESLTRNLSGQKENTPLLSPTSTHWKQMVSTNVQIKALKVLNAMLHWRLSPVT